jgi:hypothetical protein
MYDTLAHDRSIFMRTNEDVRRMPSRLMLELSQSWRMEDADSSRI